HRLELLEPGVVARRPASAQRPERLPGQVLPRQSRQRHQPVLVHCTERRLGPLRAGKSDVFVLETAMKKTFSFVNRLRTATTAFAALGLLAASQPGLAHHAFAAEFDADQ